MKTAYELALLGLTDITGCRAWDEAQDDEDDEEVPDDDLHGEEEGGEVGHGLLLSGGAAEPDAELQEPDADDEPREDTASGNKKQREQQRHGSVLRRQHSSQRSADNDHHHQQAQGLEPEIEGGHLGRLLNVFHQEFRWDAALLANEGCDDAITDPRREHVRPLVYRLVCDAKRFGGGGDCPPEVFDGF